MAAPTLKEQTAKGLVWGAFGNATQQLAGVISGIILARLISPHDYGLFSMLLIFTAIASLLQDSGFTTALINKKDAKDEDYNAVFWFSCSIGVCLYAIFFLAAPYIALYYKAPELTSASRVLFLWFLFGCTGTVHNAILIKRLMMKEKTRSDLTAFFASCVVALGMALCGMAYWSLIAQMVVQGFVGVCLRWYYSPWRPSLSFNAAPLKKMFPFSAKLLFTGIFNVINDNIFALILGISYSKAQAGFYAQGRKWSYMSYSAIWGMAGNVSQAVLAQVAGTNDRQQAVFRKLISFIAYVTFPSMLGLAFISEEFITITVGEKWLPSIPYMRLFCLWAIVTPLNNICTNTIISRGKSNIYMYGTITLDIVQLLVIYFSAPLGVFQMVINYVITCFVWFFVWFHFVKTYTGVRLIEVLVHDIMPFFCITIVAIGTAHLLTSSLANICLRILCKVVVVAGIYIAILYAARSVMLKESIQYIQKIVKR